MKKESWMKFQYIFPFLGPLVLLIVFSATTGGKLWTSHNLLSIMDAMIPLILGGSGMIFVVAQGSCDISMGSAVAFAGTTAALACQSFGFIAYFPVAILVGAAVGLFNGVMLSKFKVQSLMVTLAMLIALRALVSYITNGSVIYVTSEVLSLDSYTIKIPIFLVLIGIMYYLFEHTKIGYFSKSVGENEVAGAYTGIHVKLYKVIAFTLSGIMAGIVGAFTVGRIGGVDPTMGSFFELEVMIALFVGGVPVMGGSGSKFYRLFIGALTLALLKNGLTLSKASPEASELIEGIILIGVVFFTLYTRSKFIRLQTSKK